MSMFAAGYKIRFGVGVCSLLMVVGLAQAIEPWATYRGNPERTGNTDGKAGPAKPGVIWSMQSKDHFVAAPMPVGDRLLVSGLGPFNVANFFCLSTDVKPPTRVLWTKTSPFLKLP